MGENVDEIIGIEEFNERAEKRKYLLEIRMHGQFEVIYWMLRMVQHRRYGFSEVT